MNIEIDAYAGFCGGVASAIKLAEQNINAHEKIYCLDEIVHNQAELMRLTKEGLILINEDQFRNIYNAKVLIRAHGEPPQTYQIAQQNNIELIDATCKVVTKLQQKVKHASTEMSAAGGQIVIFGRKDHPEVRGLIGNCQSDIIIIQNEKDLSKIDFQKPIHFFAQTTNSIHRFRELAKEIKKRMKLKYNGKSISFQVHETVCKQVSSREEHLKLFAKKHDVIIFVGGANSSNAKYLFDLCKAQNQYSYFINDASQIDINWFNQAKEVGITGATSTPNWLMEEVKLEIDKL